MGLGGGGRALAARNVMDVMLLLGCLEVGESVLAGLGEWMDDGDVGWGMLMDGELRRGFDWRGGVSLFLSLTHSDVPVFWDCSEVFTRRLHSSAAGSTLGDYLFKTVFNNIDSLILRILSQQMMEPGVPASDSEFRTLHASRYSDL